LNIASAGGIVHAMTRDGDNFRVLPARAAADLAAVLTDPEIDQRAVDAAWDRAIRQALHQPRRTRIELDYIRRMHLDPASLSRPHSM
jgi:hypothetical protein